MNTTREMSIRSETKLYFLENANPCLIGMLITNIGFPRQIYEDLCEKYHGRCEPKISALFDIWYPYAEKIAKKNDILPIHILAFARHHFPDCLIRAPKLPGMDLDMFVGEKKNERLVDRVTDQIKTDLPNSYFRILDDDDENKTEILQALEALKTHVDLRHNEMLTLMKKQQDDLLNTITQKNHCQRCADTKKQYFGFGSTMTPPQNPVFTEDYESKK